MEVESLGDKGNEEPRALRQQAMAGGCAGQAGGWRGTGVAGQGTWAGRRRGHMVVWAWLRWQLPVVGAVTSTDLSRGLHKGCGGF